MPAVFLAGGITNNPIWHDVVCEALSDLNIVVLDPRREIWPTDPAELEQQIRWEYQMMRKADCVAFWFPKESLCPITLYELGCMLNYKKHVLSRLCIGRDPEYPRAKELDLQLKVHDYQENILHASSSLEQLIKHIRLRFD
jgi:hypothetical protein